MFLKILSEFDVINDAYVISMQLKKTGDKYEIHAQFINGATRVLKSFPEAHKNDAENDFRRLVQEGNLQHTITYRGPELK